MTLLLKRAFSGVENSQNGNGGKSLTQCIRSPDYFCLFTSQKERSWKLSSWGGWLRVVFQVSDDICKRKQHTEVQCSSPFNLSLYSKLLPMHLVSWSTQQLFFRITPGQRISEVLSLLEFSCHFVVQKRWMERSRKTTKAKWSFSALILTIFGI